ncbi:MarR family transcriptional regulator [Oculatella sp. FACHB-28]|uniref:MarR family winged helix-turn-helix transcriptional regulator n=1 Tax=Oculatella sp. FACHB-28 TaxID=2692845 RepID=UPI0016850FB2|nr:MarR family transcriptional regulator [Oculatella sp. FACHB-28]MBD2060118.1 MarR family transcriptional regulator [Oculatella sp. FACHB-28]
MVPQSTNPEISQKSLRQWQHVMAPYGLGYRIKLLSQLMARKFQERLDPFGLTPFHWVVLCCLWEENGLATSSIGEKLQQVGGTLTGVLDRMEERGLVRRERDRQDRRIWRIWLTEAGDQLKQELLPIAQDIREETLEGMSETERQVLSGLVDQAIANLSKTH